MRRSALTLVRLFGPNIATRVPFHFCGSQPPVGAGLKLARRVRLLIICLGATLASAGPAGANNSVYAAIPLANVRQIDIVASWGGLGPREYEHTIIQRTGNTLVVDDQPVGADKAKALIVALFAKPQREPSLNLIASQAQEYSIDYFAKEGLRECAGDGADLKGVRSFFARLFFDTQNQRRWLADEYSAENFHTDDYPEEKVTVTLVDGSTVAASSQSQKTLMLPFNVVRNGASYTTFDDRIPRAIAALTVGGVNSERLDGGEPLFSTYSNWLCEAFRNDIELAVLDAWAPRLAQFIRSEGIVTDGLRLDDDFSTLYGRLRFPEWPKEVTYQVFVGGKPLDSTSISNAGLRLLRQTKERGDSITSLPWIQHWFATAQQPKMFLETFVGGTNSLNWGDTVADLKSRSPTAYNAVIRNLHSAVRAMMWEGKGNEALDTILFLADGYAVDLNRGTLIDRQGRTVTQ